MTYFPNNLIFSGRSFSYHQEKWWKHYYQTKGTKYFSK